MSYTDAMKTKKNLSVGDAFKQVRLNRGYSIREMAKALKSAGHSRIVYAEDNVTEDAMLYFKLLAKHLHLTAVEKDLIKQAMIAKLKQDLEEI